MGSRAPPDINGLVSLKVDNISYNTTQNELRRLFDRYGEIGDVHIPRDKYTRQSKGFGFVRFYNRRDAEYAMDKVDGKFIDGRELRVTIARYDRPLDDRGWRGGRHRSRSPRRSRSRSPPSRSRSRSRSPRRRRDRTRSRSPPGSPRNNDRSRSPTRSRSNSRRRSASPAHSRSGSR